MIKLNDDYGIVIDGMNYTLVKISIAKSGKSAGKMMLKPMSYCSNMVSVLNSFADYMKIDSLRDVDCDLPYAIKRIESACKEVKHLIEKAVPKVKVVDDE